MEINEVICRVRVKQLDEESDGVSLKDFPDADVETRHLWASHIVRAFESTPEVHDTIRGWDIFLRPDGSVQFCAIAPLPVEGGDHGENMVYPARFRIPESDLIGLGREAKAKRAEMFALGSLLYEVISGRKPLEDLSDDDVQHKYRSGEFPDEVLSMPLGDVILQCWDQSCIENVGEPGEGTESMGLRFIRASGKYIKDHPVQFALQTTGAVIFTTSIIALPVLGAAGFTAAGPAAGSAAAAWQASIGLVEAGSVFAWCQSAAMGGAALNGIIATGAAGAGMATMPGIPKMVQTCKGFFSREKKEKDK